jgi:hypothetical protein
LALICIVGASCASWAQAGQQSWTNLGVLHERQKIQVVDMNSKKYSGTFVNFSETALSYQGTKGEQTIQKQDVRRVKLMENKHRMRNTLIGAAVGAGAGAVIGAASYQPCSPSQFLCIQPVARGAIAGIGAVVGSAAGAVVGALLPSHSTIYSVN